MIQKFISENYENEYYIHLLKDSMEKYIKKKTVTNAKNCLKESIVYGPLCAYRLFYVGCSRARKNLAIVIKKLDIEEFEEKVYQKFESCGFKVNHVNESIRKVLKLIPFIFTVVEIKYIILEMNNGEIDYRNYRYVI